MGLIPQSVIEDVLAQTDILEVVRQYVALKKAGTNHKGLCPFHDENTPSFNVHPGMGIYKCFGCGEGGNVIGFLMAMEGWNFPETVRHLAERGGIEIPEESPEEVAKEKKRREGKKLYRQIMADGQAYFETNLWSDQGRAAQMYLAERGISELTARAFGLGYAPEGWENLLTHMKQKGYKPLLLERAGLVLANDRGGHYDRFRHRIVFPVVDVWGHTLAFGGRTLARESKGAKYINSPETKFYTKGRQLYGLDVAKRAIQKQEYALVVEGNFDVIALHEQGIETAVAPMGTALTEDQARLIKRFARRVVLAFDGDHAGQEATLRCLEAMEAAGLEARVVRFEAGDDPDTFVRRQGAGALQKKIDAAPPLVAWALDEIIHPVEGAAIEVRIGALEQVGELLDQVRDDTVTRHYAEEAARRLAIEPARVARFVQRSAPTRQAMAEQWRQVQTAIDWSSAEYGVLVVLLDNPQWLNDFFREELDKLLTSHDLSRLLILAREHVTAQGELNGSLLLESIEQPPLREMVSQALAEGASGGLYPADQGLRWYRDCVWTLKRSWSQRMAHHLQQELERLDFSSDREQFEILSRQLDEIRQFKRALDLDGRRAHATETRAG